MLLSSVFFFTQNLENIQSGNAKTGVLHVLFVFCYPVRRVIAVVEEYWEVVGGGY